LSVNFIYESAHVTGLRCLLGDIYVVSVTWKKIAPGSVTFHADSLLHSKKQAVGPYPEQNGS